MCIPRRNLAGMRGNRKNRRKKSPAWTTAIRSGRTGAHLVPRCRSDAVAALVMRFHTAAGTAPFVSCVDAVRTRRAFRRMRDRVVRFDRAPASLELGGAIGLKRTFDRERAGRILRSMPAAQNFVVDVRIELVAKGARAFVVSGAIDRHRPHAIMESRGVRRRRLQPQRSSQ